MKVQVLEKKHYIIIGVAFSVIIGVIVYFQLKKKSRTKNKKIGNETTNNDKEPDKNTTTTEEIIDTAKNIRQLNSYQNLTTIQKQSFSDAIKYDYTKMLSTKQPFWRNDNENLIYWLLERMSKSYFYQFKVYFQKTNFEKKSLEQFFSSYLNTNELAKVNEIINKMK